MAIKLFALDVDGVLTDGTLYYTAEGEQTKAFNAQDGLGLKLLCKLGVEIAVISGRGGPVLERRLDDLGITERRLKCSDKLTALQDICADLGIGLDVVAFMGDDLIDLKAMRACAIAIAPENAVADIKFVAHHVTSLKGGQGAAREACEYLAQGLGTSLLAAYEAGQDGVSQ